MREPTDSQVRRPNLLFVLADQLRAMCLDPSGTPGADPVETPHVDALSAEGVNLPHAVSCYPVCSPHRAMFITSQYPHLNGVTHNVNSLTAADGIGLPWDSSSWARILKEGGYRTGWIGKWHLEPPTAEDALFGEGRREDGLVWDAYSPPHARHGFGFWYSYGCCDDHLRPHYWAGDAARESRIDVDQWSAEHETDVAIGFLEEAATEGGPFALCVSFNPPHQPFHQLPPWADLSYGDLPPERLLLRPNVDLNSAAGAEAAAIAPLYYTAVAGIDVQIGRLTAALDRLGLSKDTLVVVTSDHGQQMGSHGLLYKNVPFEESLRVPFVARLPGRLPAGTRPQALLSSVDIGPTLLGLLAAPPLPGAAGQDRSAALRGVTQGHPDRALYFRWPDDEAMTGGPRTSLSPALEDPASHVRGLRTPQSMTVVAWSEAAGLTRTHYDLAADPFQLAPRLEGDELDAACRILADELIRIGDPFPGLASLERNLS